MPHTSPSRLSLALLLAAGIALVVGANMQHGIALLAFVAPIPWLRFLRTTRGAGSRVVFSLVLVLAWCLTTLKIVSEPLPLGFALLGVGFGLREVVAYLVWDRVQRRAHPLFAALAFPAIMAVTEWAQYRFTSLSSWGGAGYTQVGHLALLQVASIAGVVGVGFLVNAVAAAFEAASAASAVATRTRVVAALAPVAVAVLASLWGAQRLREPLGPEVRVATVDTTATFGASPALPAAPERARIVSTLLDDTRRAAREGARLVVWTEAAALTLGDEQASLVERASRVAREENVDVVAAFIAPRSLEPLAYENKLVWLTPSGTVAHEYLKHRPVPGEPAIPGTEPLEAIDTAFGRAGVALCYDYDFPALAREHAALGVDIVALPSSDWRGIDPVHTEMAALRAIETGASIVRSTRFGLSAGIDSTGRLHGVRSSFSSSDRVSVTSLPRERRETFYATHGDWLVGLLSAFLLLGAFYGLRSRPASSSALTASSLVGGASNPSGGFGGV